MQKELTDLLQRIHSIQKVYDALRDKEEKFNLFSVLHKAHDEVKLHTRFTAHLLSPQASHRLQATFLNKFIDLFPKLDKSNYPNAVVFPQEWDKKEKSLSCGATYTK